MEGRLRFVARLLDGEGMSEGCRLSRFDRGRGPRARLNHRLGNPRRHRSPVSRQSSR